MAPMSFVSNGIFSHKCEQRMRSYAQNPFGVYNFSVKKKKKKKRIVWPDLTLSDKIVMLGLLKKLLLELKLFSENKPYIANELWCIDLCNDNMSHSVIKWHSIWMLDTCLPPPETVGALGGAEVRLCLNSPIREWPWSFTLSRPLSHWFLSG